MRTMSLVPIVCLALASTAQAASSGPDEKTEALLDYWKKNGGSALDAAAPLPTDLARIFDYNQLSDSAIEPHKNRFNTKQLGRYSKTFVDILRRTVHSRAGAAIGKTDYKLSKSKKKGDNREVEVSAYLPDEDITTDVVFVWRSTPKIGWQIVDVRIDGASLVNDYRNQFGRMIGKDGVDGFLAKLERSLGKRTGNG